MRYTICHQGVPVGRAELDLANNPAVGTVDSLVGYNGIRDQVRAATRALRAVAANALSSAYPADSTALSIGAALGRALELRDGQSALVQTDFIELADWEGEPLSVTIWVRARGAMSGSPAIHRPLSANGGDTTRPDA